MSVSFRPRIVREEADHQIPEAEIISPVQPRVGIVQPESARRIAAEVARRAEIEAIRLVPSLAKEMATNFHQANLEIHRNHQAHRVGEEILESAAQSLVRNVEREKRLTALYPEVAPEIVDMVRTVNEVVCKTPATGQIAYLRRYYQGL